MGKSWTEEQRKVIETRGKSLLVSAAAGSGKTAVLVERILREILDPERPVDLDRLLIVTFTRAATAQLRERIREAVTEKYDQDPSDRRLARQMSLLYSDHIMTIDKFFLMVIREHYQQIGLDPSFRIGDEGELKLMRSDVCSAVIEEAYQEGREDFLRFSECYAGGNTDKDLEGEILDFFEASSSHAWPKEWRHRCLEQYEKDPSDQTWLSGLLGTVLKQLSDIRSDMRKTEEVCLSPGGPKACLSAVRSDIGILDRALCESSYDGLRNDLADCDFVRISKKPKKGEDPYDPGKVKRVSDERERWKKQIKAISGKFFSRPLEEEAELMKKTGADLAVLVSLTDRFEEAFSEEKTKKNILDFTDTAHLALEVLVEKTPEGEIRPTDAAREYQDYFDEIAIDEYQDSNEVQELLLSAVSKESRGVYNRFMVGDVKQSIYRFRMSDPGIFMKKYGTYRKEGEAEREEKQVRIDLHKNFRSRKEVLDAVNLVFRQIMQKGIGGVEYGSDEALYPGASYESYPSPWQGQEGKICCPELLFVSPADFLQGPEESTEADGGSAAGYPSAGLLRDEDRGEYGFFGEPEEDAPFGGLPDVKHAEAEAVAGRILQIVGHDPVWDKDTGAYRPAELRDIVILLRTSSDWANVYSEVLSEHGIPNRSGSRTGYFSAPEVQTILAYLNVLDNPRQDIPLAAALRSGIGKLTDNELAILKTGRRDKPLCDCVMDFMSGHGNGEGEEEETFRKLSRFLKITETLRERTADTPIHQLLWKIYDLTGFADLCQASPGGKQKKANLDMLVEKAIAYEQTSYRGLFHFVRYIEKLIRYEVDFGTALSGSASENLVRIMTIHASKGLEFPIVFVAGLGKKFNRSDARESMVLDPEIGAGMNYVDPDLRVQVPTLIRSAAAERTGREGIGEELRVLYVAMTRAEEKLILAGSVRDRDKTMESLFSCAGCETEKLPESQILTGDSFLFWILAALVRHPCGREFFGSVPELPESEALEGAEGSIRILTGKDVLMSGRLAAESEQEDIRNLLDAEPGVVCNRELHDRLKTQLESSYPYPDLRRIPAKVTVSELKRAGYEAEVLRVSSGLPDAAGPDTVIRDPGEKDEREADREAGEEDFDPVLPEFMREEQEKGRISGAARGTLYHRFLADFDMAAKPLEGEVSRWLETMAACDKITEDERRAIRLAPLEAFLDSDLGRRMREAARRGTLRRENPFVLAVPSGEILPDADTGTGGDRHGEDDKILVQGTIDAWFEEPDGGLVLVDYKTDHVRPGQEDSLVRRYRTQFLLYASALRRLTGREVRQAYLYSLALGETVEVELKADEEPE